ncbi:phosphotransferase family protein [Dictyobacter kobayashii]|uniref:phosphotransferase family protein n=1 Tax=Dictyobacter kobayashii TaxID=2014872 RepID=UPI000F84D287|nr:aminoglycoside phosphotransferase family protein [Dictyobacter kobayashii]
MRYTIIERAPAAFQQPVPLEQIQAMCQRAFGKDRSILSIEELAGGGHNNTYRILLAAMPPVILRVSPAHGPHLAQHELNLMRNEQYMQPFLAPIAPLMPRTLMVDFTHQLIKRDYIFQTFMEGELWSDIEHELTLEEDLALYRQLAELTKIIHGVEGETFGQPLVGHTFDRWSSLVVHKLESSIRDLEAIPLDATDVRALLDLVMAHLDLLDQIDRPRLLHGDLWTFNVLVKRDPAQHVPTISAVLDSDRCWWGDPLADWTMFLLHIRATESPDPKVVAGTRAFWQTYADAEPDPGAQFRSHVYHAMSFCDARIELQRRQSHERVRQTYQRIQEIRDALCTCGA